MSSRRTSGTTSFRRQRASGDTGRRRGGNRPCSSGARGALSDDEGGQDEGGPDEGGKHGCGAERLRTAPVL